MKEKRPMINRLVSEYPMNLGCGSGLGFGGGQGADSSGR